VVETAATKDVAAVCTVPEPAPISQALLAGSITIAAIGCILAICVVVLGVRWRRRRQRENKPFEFGTLMSKFQEQMLYQANERAKAGACSANTTGGSGESIDAQPIRRESGRVRVQPQLEFISPIEIKRSLLTSKGKLGEGFFGEVRLAEPWLADVLAFIRC